MDDRPLIITAEFDQRTFEHLDALRQAHFPPDRNVLSAHLTMFHALPGARIADAFLAIRRAVEGPPMPVVFDRLRFLGRGVALDVHAPALLAVRAALADAFGPDLTAQDKQTFRPHVTIQNKVTPAAARALHAELGARFVPWSGWITAILVWRYLGGPWRREGRIPFPQDGGADDEAV